VYLLYILEKIKAFGPLIKRVSLGKRPFMFKKIKSFHQYYSSNQFYNMSQLLLNKLKNLAGVSAMLVAFFFVGTVDASAQSRASSESNPQSVIAQKLGITACELGSATNVQGGLAALESQAATLRASINAGNASLNDKLKYFYFESVLQEVGHNHIAVEISLLKNLRKAALQVGSDNVTNQMLRNLYNSTKTLFGMC